MTHGKTRQKLLTGKDPTDMNMTDRVLRDLTDGAVRLGQKVVSRRWQHAGP